MYFNESVALSDKIAVMMLMAGWKVAPDDYHGIMWSFKVSDDWTISCGGKTFAPSEQAIFHAIQLGHCTNQDLLKQDAWNRSEVSDSPAVDVQTLLESKVFGDFANQVDANATVGSA